jgi:hypothetical protein
VTPVSEIKLIRTDTTLDLSQKAEKVCLRKQHAEVLGRLPHAGVVGTQSLEFHERRFGTRQSESSGYQQKE